MKQFFKLLSLTLVIIFSISIVSFARDVSYEESLAMELKELGVFRGVSDTEFDLERAPTRVEALVMLIRILGVEDKVSEGVWRHPFTDVPKWADKYVGYAYSNGLTNGQSLTLFGNGDASATMYLTFVLRSLGYSDENNADFSWKDPYTLSSQIGILNDRVNTTDFLRADVVVVSYNALTSYMNGTDKTLSSKLIEAGVFSEGNFKRIYSGGKQKQTASDIDGSSYNAEQIYKMCSSSVFYIELYNVNDEAYGSGSGFFINDEGVAITNYHVIDGAYSACVQTVDGNVYDITGVYNYSQEQDWAVIQVDCLGNDYLKFGDASTIVGGTSIFTIGSPKGLQNTISEGLISNVSRWDGYTELIQISAPISNGSSGGALINKYGEVIGITSSILVEGQNLNFCIPVHIVDISTDTQLLMLKEVYTMHYGTVAPSQNKIVNFGPAYFYLKHIVEEESNYTFDDGVDAFNLSVETEEAFCDVYLFYNEKFDSLNIELWYLTDELCIEYVMDVESKLNESSFIMLAAYDYENKEIARGFAYVDISDFNSKYLPRFYDYEGDYDIKLECEGLATILHGLCLEFINEIFVTMYENGSNDLYTVYDLGYVNY